MASTSLKSFTAGQLANALGETLGRGRPSFEQRADLEARVTEARKAGEVRISKGKLVRVEGE
jgi:hypothetical protein